MSIHIHPLWLKAIDTILTEGVDYPLLTEVVDYPRPSSPGVLHQNLKEHLTNLAVNDHIVVYLHPTHQEEEEEPKYWGRLRVKLSKDRTKLTTSLGLDYLPHPNSAQDALQVAAFCVQAASLVNALEAIDEQAIPPDDLQTRFQTLSALATELIDTADIPGLTGIYTPIMPTRCVDVSKRNIAAYFITRAIWRGPDSSIQLTLKVDLLKNQDTICNPTLVFHIDQSFCPGALEEALAHAQSAVNLGKQLKDHIEAAATL